MDFGTQIDYLLIRPPGSLLYHLVLAFSIIGALIGAYNQWRATEFPQARRTVIGLVFLLTLEVAQYFLGVLSFQVRAIPELVLPPLDRAFLVINLSIIIWLWAFPEPVGRGDTATLVVVTTATVGLIVNVLLRWQSGAAGPFNNTYENLAWEIFALALAAIGGLLLLRRKPAGWQFGLSALVVLFLGVLVDTIWPTPADGQYSIFVRVAAMSAYPMLLTLPHRFQGATERRAPRAPVRAAAGEAGEDQQAFQERRRYSTDPKTLHALLALASETDADRINQSMSRAISQSMLADLCFIIYLGDDKKQLIISSGYDLIREENLEGGLLNRESIPMLSSAIQRGKPLRLPASTTSSDLKGLGDLLGLASPGNLLNVPITTEKGPMGGILLLSPYSSRAWSAEDQTFLSSISDYLVPLIERGRKITNIEMARERAERTAQDALARASDAERERGQAVTEVERIREETKDARQQAEALATATQAKNELEARIRLMESELNELRAQESVSTSSGSQMENELRQTLKEMARLQNALADANIKILELENSAGPSRRSSNEQVEVVASMAQELRQPMSSIVGYTDLLLSESVGILGALQRKFIERIKASTERIDNLINDLIQVTAVDRGNIDLKPEMVDLNLIIDNAMAYTSSQLREKNITLRIDLPQTLGPVHADREAMQQILIHLLQNAGAASPIEGTVTLRVHKQQEKGQDFILVQVSDTGGGIPENDLPRVFSRLYRADNVLIQGVGDTGVGLSLAKTLTEAQGGRIWVDSEMNVGATFHVLLPVGEPPANTHTGG